MFLQILDMMIHKFDDSKNSDPGPCEFLQSGYVIRDFPNPEMMIWGPGMDSGRWDPPMAVDTLLTIVSTIINHF